MTFPEALAAMKSGAFVKRKRWAICLFIKDGKLLERFQTVHQAPILRGEDVLADDWEVAEPSAST